MFFVFLYHDNTSGTKKTEGEDLRLILLLLSNPITICCTVLGVPILLLVSTNGFISSRNSDLKWCSAARLL